MQEDIREAVVAVVEVDLIVEIPARTTIKIMVKVTVRIRIINSRNIPARETRMEVTIEAVGTIIRTGEKAEEEGEEAEFKVDGIKVPIILVRIVINVAATVEAETNTEDVTLRIFLTLAEVSHKKIKL